MRVIALLLVFISAAADNSHWPVGNPACPCIDPWEHNLALRSNAPTTSGMADCDIQRSGDGLCYPRSYGAGGCAAYDANRTPECIYSEITPDWCNFQWCYVDPSNCDRPYLSSPFFHEARLTNLTGEIAADCASTYRAERPLAVSYTTCGFLDTYAASSDGIKRSLQNFVNKQPGGQLRVSFPDDSSSKYTLVGLGEYPQPRGGLKVEPGQGVGGSNRSGSIPVFLNNIMLRYNISWVEIPISARSREFSPGSSFTACVHEVAIGNTDMCWGNFWPTAARRQMATFSATIYQDEFFIIVPLGRDESGFFESIRKPFDPFTPSLWLVIILTFGTVGVTLTWENQEERVSFWDFATDLMPIAILKGLNAYNLGEVYVNYRNSGSWMTGFFVGFTFQVLITGYTAVVTNTLMTAGTTRVTTLQGAIDRGYRICVTAPMIPGLIAQYPGIGSLLVETPNGQTLAGMDAGYCDAALMQEDAWRGARYFGQTEACQTKGRLRETITVVPNAVPLRTEIEQAVSYAITRDVEFGLYTQVRDEARRNYTYNQCVEAPTNQGRTQFGLADLGGPMVFLVVAAFISMIVTRLGHATSRAKDRLKKQLDTDHKGAVTTPDVVHAVVSGALHLRNGAVHVPSSVRDTLRGEGPRISVCKKRFTNSDRSSEVSSPVIVEAVPKESSLESARHADHNRRRSDTLALGRRDYTSKRQLLSSRQLIGSQRELGSTRAVGTELVFDQLHSGSSTGQNDAELLT